MSNNLADRLISRGKALSLFGIVLGIFGLALLFKGLETDDDYVALLPAGDSSAADYDRYLYKFKNDAGAIVVATGDIFSPQGWQLQIELTQALEKLDGVDQVIGLATAEHVSGNADLVEVGDFITPETELNQQLAMEAIAYQPYQDLLVRTDPIAVAIYVVAKQDIDTIALSRNIQAVVDQFRPRFESEPISGDLFQSGELAVSAELSAATDRSSALIAGVIVVMLFTVWFLTKSFRVGLLAAMTGGSAALIVFGTMSLLNIAQNPVNILPVNLIISLGAAFTIHAFGYVQRGGHKNFGFIPESALKPFGFATVTTLLGFGATSISDIPAIQQFGLLGCLGILACLFVTMTMTFPLMAKMKRSAKLYTNSGQVTLLSGGNAIALASFLALISFFGISLLELNYAPINYLESDNPVHVDFTKAEKLFGTYVIPFVVFGLEENQALDPKLWRDINQFALVQEQTIPGLQIATLYDQLSEFVQAMTAGDDEPLNFPDSPELMAQSLIWFDPDTTDLYLDFEQSSITVLFQTPIRSSNEFSKLEAKAQQFREQFGLDAVLTGRVAQFFRAGDAIAQGNRRALLIGMTLVFIWFVFLLRSFSLGFIAVSVNGLPVIGSLAMLGIFGVDLDIGTSIVAAVALGLVVDDTGHFLAHYNSHRYSGRSAETAARLTVAELWRPIVFTTVAIILGFSVMNLADLVPFHTFSRLLSGTMLYALLCDLVLLPSLLAVFDKRDFSWIVAERNLRAGMYPTEP